ncbi:MAG TPA: hypothetical protein V6C64_15045 [Microcoleaceae cyanobacterium]|jgi:hypothetical protein
MLTNPLFLGSAIDSAYSIAESSVSTQSLYRTTPVQPLAWNQITQTILPTKNFQHFRRPEIAQFYAVVLSRGGRIGC